MNSWPRRCRVWTLSTTSPGARCPTQTCGRPGSRDLCAGVRGMVLSAQAEACRAVAGDHLSQCGQELLAAGLDPARGDDGTSRPRGDHPRRCRGSSRRRCARSVGTPGAVALADEQRIAITLMDLNGFSASQVARMTRSPRGTVLSRVHRGRKRLAQILSKEVERLET